MPRFDFVDPRKLWVSYLLALGLLFSLITFSHFAGMIFGGDGARAASDINISGRQRMLSQRILYFSQRHIGAGYEDPEAAKSLRDAVTLFSDSHNGLVSETDRALSPASHALYFGSNGAQLDKESRAFVADAMTVLEGPRAQRRSAYQRMATVGPYVLLAHLNEAVTAFENEAKRLDKLSHTWGYIGFGLAILALFLEGLFIFRPAHQTIVQAMDDLEENNDQLKQQQAEAFAALEDSEDAWAEAESARKDADALVISTRQQVSALRAELATPINAIDHHLDTFATATLNEAQRQNLVDMSRCNAMARALVDDYAAGLQDHAEQQGEKERPFAPLDLLNTAVRTIKAAAPENDSKITLGSTNAQERKVIGPPVGTLRLLCGLVQQALLVERWDSVTLSLEVARSEDALALRLELTGTPVPTEDAPLSPPPQDAIDRLARQNAIGAGVDRDMLETGQVKLSAWWQAKPATVRTSRKGKKLRRSAS